MGLTMAERRAVTRATAVRYRAASKSAKAVILDELCELTGWHRDHARKALRAARGPRRVLPQRAPRTPVYGEEVMAALRKVWAVLDTPAGKRMAPFLPEVVARLRACGELDLDDAAAESLCSMSAATIDRRLAPDRAKLAVRGRSGTKPGSLLKSQIPIRTWADWDEQAPGFVEIDLVGHEGGDPRGDFCQTLTVTDILTGWTETRAVRNKAQKWVFAALEEITEGFPFQVLGIDSDNGSEFINAHLLRCCTEHQITFTRSRPGRKNDGAHVEQKNWSVVRRAVGYHRYDTPAEVVMLNQLYELVRLQTSFFAPQQKLIEKTRHEGEGDQAVRHRRHPVPTGPGRRPHRPGRQGRPDRPVPEAEPGSAAPRHPALSDQLLEHVRANGRPTRLPTPAPPLLTRASTREATKRRSRAP